MELIDCKPGREALDPQGRVVRILEQGQDASGVYLKVRLRGSYGATVRLPPSCLSPYDPDKDEPNFP